MYVKCLIMNLRINFRIDTKIVVFLYIFFDFYKVNKLFCNIISNINNKINLIMAATKITVLSNGSIKIDGDFELVDMEGNNYGLGDRTAIFVCRCGLSKNKPFCDGSHKNNFDHEAKSFDLPAKK